MTVLSGAAAAFAQDSSPGAGNGDAGSSADGAVTTATRSSSASDIGVTAGDLPSVLTPDLTGPVTQFDVARAITTPSGFVPLGGSPANVRSGVHLFISETGRYEDNARRIPDGFPTPLRRSRDDFSSVTTVGGSASAQLGLQTFYIRGNYALTRYRSDTDLNSDLYSVEGGINWRTGSFCNGTLAASTNQNELGLQEATLGNIRALTTTNRADFNGRCHLYDRFYAVFGASGTEYEVSTVPLNSYRQALGRGGIEYALPKLYTLGVETVFTDSDYFNRVGALGIPLATDVQQQNVRAYLTYIVSPKTTLQASGGVAQLHSTSPFFSSDRTLPTYTFSASWKATPKIVLQAGRSYTVGPASGILSDYQSLMTTTASVTYTYSGKLSFSGFYAHSRTKSSSLALAGFAGTARELVTDTLALNVTYRFTPFLDMRAGYQFSEQDDKLLAQKYSSNRYLISLNYRR